MLMCFRLSKIKFFRTFNTILIIFVVYTFIPFYLNYYHRYKNNLVHSYDPNFKYILLWTSGRDYKVALYMQPLVDGRGSFIKKNCRFQNCFMTSDRYFFKDIKLYDVIAFNGQQVIYINDFPKHRSPRQKYVFVSYESSHYYPVCDDKINGYFNWTWTYKIKSDVVLEYSIVRNKNGEIIGPRQVMHWLDINEMVNVTNEIIEKLKTKTKAAAWLVSNCYTPGKREKFVEELQKELKRFGLKVDVYGGCGSLKFSRNATEIFETLLQKDYYFYLSFENSFSEDYVTEKLLRALQNYAIPVVYGGSNYTRFMPDGSYLNARELGPRKLSEAMNEIIRDRERYYSFFKWHNHYTYHVPYESPDTDDLCKICEMLNDKQTMEKETVYHDFKSWWNPAEVPEVCHSTPSLSLRAFLRKLLF